MMIRAGSLYETCDEIFAEYPLALDGCNDDVQSLALMLREGDQARFFIVSRDCSDGRPFFLLRPWHDKGMALIEADSDTVLSDTVVSVLTRGVPIPRHGSLFGWKAGDLVTAMIVVDAEYAARFPQPSWAVLPRADAAKTQWPPFTGEAFFGQWFWEYHRTGAIVSLGDLVAMVPDTVFWVDAKDRAGWGLCIVSRDVQSGEGYTLSRGCYVYHRVLREGGPMPPLAALLADGSKTDLAPRFQSCACSGGQLRG